MKVNNKKSKSIFRYVIFSFALFTGIIIIIGVVIVTLATIRINSLSKRPEKEKMSIIAQTIIQHDFNENEIEELLGVDAVLELYDESLDLLYTYGYSVDGRCDAISFEELAAIPIYDERSIVITETGISEVGEEMTIISTYNYIEEEQVILSMIVLDKDYYVIYSTNSESKERYSETEVQYLTQTSSEDYFVYKYPFTDGNGQNLNLIIKTLKHETIIDNIFLKSYYIDALLFSILYVTVFGIFILIMRNQLNRPIKILNNALIDYANGVKNTEITYSGAKEFEQICQSFNNMATKLEISEAKRIEIEKEKDKITCNISHDLKTPITVIHGYLNAINDGLISDEKREKYLQIIYNKSKDLVELISDFHDFNKLNHPDYSFSYEEVDICEYSREYLIDKYNELELLGYEMEIDIPDDIVICNIDKTQLKRVFENIIGNSIKHNTETIQIGFNMTVNNENVVIEIADTGKGISKDILDEIFNPFVGSNNNDNKSGLGLYICKVIVEGHGGTIRYKSNEKYSSIFEISLKKRNE